MRPRHPFIAVLGAAMIGVTALALPAQAADSKATFSGGADGRARGGSPDCFTAVRSDGRARFMSLNGFRVGKVQYAMQAGFFGSANQPGRHDLVDDAPPGVTVLLVRSKDRRQWASTQGRITLSDDGLVTKLRATLVPTVPARGPDIAVKATIACETVEDLPDPGA